MQVTAFALKNSRITVLGILLITLMGIMTFRSYPSAEDPSVVIRNVVITAFYPGMAADRVEDLITEPLESALREIAEIDEIKSTSKTGDTLIEVTVHDSVENLEPVFQDIRNKVSDTANQLPSDTVGPFVNDEVGLTAIATIALWADGFSLAELRDTARDIRDRIYGLDGIRRVEFFGIQEERIYLETTPGKLAQYGVSPQEIFGQLVQQNVIEPGGSISADGRDVLVEPSGNFENVDEIRGVVFKVPGTTQVARLDDVVSIRRTYADPPDKPVFFNDQPALVLSVSTVEGTNNVEFGTRLTALLGDIQNGLPIGYVVDYATFQPDLIEESVQSAVSNVYQTLAIVLVVVMLFLGLRTGLIVGSFVPLTMLLVVIVMGMFDIEMQRMSIAATIIALGLLVDNGVVVAEDIRVRLESGADRTTAAVEAGRTLALPLLTSSLTTIFAFLPMLLLEGGAGDYVRSLSQVVTILLLGSWLLSMTVTPAMCAWFMKVDAESTDSEPSRSGLIYRAYSSILGLLLRSRYAFIGALVLFLFGALQILGTIRTEFFPLGERNQFLIYLDFEAGTDIREVATDLRPLTRWLADEEANPEIASHIAYVGAGGPRFFLALSPVDPDPHRAFVLVNTRDPSQVSPMIDRVNNFLRANLPGTRGDAKKMWFGSTEPGIVQIRLSGLDSDVLAGAAGKIVDAYHAIPGTVGIKDDWENRILKLIVDVDQVRARRAGVTSSDVANALNATFAGLTLSDYREGDKTIPIVFRAEEDVRNSLYGLQRALVYSPQTGEFINLEQVANVYPDWQFGRIKRFNRERTLTVEARSTSMPAPLLYEAVLPTIEALDLPDGYRWELDGEIADQDDANTKLYGMLPLALSGILLLLVGQFNSFRRAGIILATIPLIMIGGVLGLLVMNAAFGFMVLLGFFSLAGILINNGIVLIDRIEIELAAGRAPLEAVTEACLARLRPILMTTLTTVLGLVPLILFGGALFYGMASVIAYGLIVATIITLGFVPVLYTLLFRIPIAAKEEAAA